MKKTQLIPFGLSVAFLFSLLSWNACSSGTESTATAGQDPVEQPAPPMATSNPASPATVAESHPAGGIQWISWDEAVKANEHTPKMVFIDVYTDWCGWCKVMDKQTFTDPEVIKHMNENYYAVKFNAEKEDPVVFRGQEFKVVEGGRRGIHTLAYALLDGQLSYPSYVYLNDQFQRLTVSKGFKPAEPFLSELQSITEQATQ